MKKSIPQVISFSVITALVCIGCSDDGAQNKSAEVGDFITMFVGGGARYTLSVDIKPNGSGHVTRIPDTTSYKAGSTVTVKATAATGFRFAEWTGDVTDLSDSVTITMNGAISLTANFISTAVASYTLTVNATPSDGGNVSCVPSQIRYNAGDSVTVTAEAVDGYTFTGWTGAANTADRTVTIKMNSDTTLTANFQKILYTLATSVLPSGGGSVSRSPNQTNYTYGDSVTVTAIAAEGYLFDGWSGDTTSTTNSVTITMNRNKTMTANFYRVSFTDTRDGKTYKVVKIGNQKWMAENLNYQTTDSWCNWGKVDTCTKYGRLYTWDAAKTACPTGWHLPSSGEWEILLEFVGERLTISGNGTDEYGFSAMFGGGNSNLGDGNTGSSAFWWTATDDSDAYAYVWLMWSDGYGLVHWGSIYKSKGASVRCVADN